MPDDVIKTMNRWGHGQKAITFGNKLEFLNRAKQHFDWENEELDLDDMVDEKRYTLVFLLRFQECLSNLILSQS